MIQLDHHLLPPSNSCAVFHNSVLQFFEEFVPWSQCWSFAVQLKNVNQFELSYPSGEIPNPLSNKTLLSESFSAFTQSSATTNTTGVEFQTKCYLIGFGHYRKKYPYDSKLDSHIILQSLVSTKLAEFPSVGNETTTGTPSVTNLSSNKMCRGDRKVEEEGGDLEVVFLRVIVRGYATVPQMSFIQFLLIPKEGNPGLLPLQ